MTPHNPQENVQNGSPFEMMYPAIMPPDSEAPDDAFRRKQAEYLPRFFQHIECAIAVFEGGGFMASLKRSALVAILLLSRKRFPVFVRSSLQQALVDDPPQTFGFDGAAALAAIERLERGAESERQLKRA